MSAPDMLEAALSYAARGWAVLPLHTPTGQRCSCGKPACTSAGKHPRTQNGLKEASTDPDQIMTWWTRWPDANIGIVTGATSGGLVAIDVDNKRFGDDNLRELADRFGGLPTTPMSLTGGGYHLLFLSTTEIRNSAGRVAGGVDVRGTGGYIVAPPSLHHSGRRYEWEGSSDPFDADEPVALARLPEWIATLAAEPSRNQRAAIPAAGTPIADGGRNETLFRIGCRLRRSGIGEDAICSALLAENEQRCQPPLGEEEVRKIASHAAKYEPGDPVPEAIVPRAPTQTRDDGEQRTRGTIIVTADIATMVEQAIRELSEAGQIYQRDGRLVKVVRTPDPQDATIRYQGAPRVLALTQSSVREELSRACNWTKLTREGGETPTTPPASVVGAIADRGEWPSIRPLVGIVQSPTIRPDGSILEAPGYDTQTGYLLEPRGPLFKVERSPSENTARAALAALREPFAEFPWAGPESESAIIAAILTIMARPAIVGAVPAFVVDKNVRGAGGSLITDAVGIIATGQSPARMTWRSDEAELEKVLGACALQAPAILCFDNIDSDFRGGPLDKVITATDEVQLRVLGKSEIPSVKWRTTIIGSGNNVSVTGDTIRRVLVARVVSPDEKPENRTDFRIPDLIGWIRAHRNDLARAALTILRAYFVAGRPTVGTKPWGSFEAWSSLIPPAVVFAGGSDPMLARPTDDGLDDPDKLAHMSLLDHLPRLGPKLTAKQIIDAIGTAGPAQKAVREALEQLLCLGPGEAVSVHRLGKKLGALKDRPIVGKRIVKGEKDGTAVWSVDDTTKPSASVARAA